MRSFTFIIGGFSGVRRLRAGIGVKEEKEEELLLVDEVSELLASSVVTVGSMVLATKLHLSCWCILEGESAGMTALFWVTIGAGIPSDASLGTGVFSKFG